MKKIIYILTLFLMIQGIGFANPVDFLRNSVFSLVEKPSDSFSIITNSKKLEANKNPICFARDLCIIPAPRSLDNIFRDITEHDECVLRPVLSYWMNNINYIGEEMKTQDILVFNKVVEDLFEIIQNETLENSNSSYMVPVDSKFKRLYKLKFEKNFFPVDVNDHEGLGIRLRI